MPWLFENTHVEQLPEDCVGFVYIITNKLSGRRYIGKKLSKFSKTTYKIVKLKNGTKKRKRIKSKVESDWQQYTGSSVEDAVPHKDNELIQSPRRNGYQRVRTAVINGEHI